MKKYEKISIIIPVYNGASTLEKCVTSILNQTEQDFRIYLVDDCSEDDSWEKIKQLAQMDNRINIFQMNKNSGPSVARNVALQAVNGEWISFIDSDDYIEPTYYERMIESSEKNKSDIVIASFIQVNENGKQMRSYIAKSEYIASTPEKALQVAYGGKDDLEFSYNLCCNKLFRRKLFSEIRFPEGRLQEDAFVMPYLIYSATKGISIAPDAIYYYVDNHSSISYQAQNGMKDLKRREDLLYLYQEHIKLYKDKGNKLYLRCQSNYLQNVIAIYHLHYHALNSQCRDEFKKIQDDFTKVYKDAKKSHNPYLPTKLKISFLIFTLSPSLYLKMF